MNLEMSHSTSSPISAQVAEESASATTNTKNLLISETENEFSVLFRMRGTAFFDAYDKFIIFADPETLITKSLADLDAYGNIDRLVLAGRVLANMGDRAWPA